MLQLSSKRVECRSDYGGGQGVQSMLTCRGAIVCMLVWQGGYMLRHSEHYSYPAVIPDVPLACHSIQDGPHAAVQGEKLHLPRTVEYQVVQFCKHKVLSNSPASRASPPTSCIAYV